MATESAATTCVNAALRTSSKIRLEEELSQAKQVLEETHTQHLQNVREEVIHRYEAQVAQLPNLVKTKLTIH